MEPNKEKRVSLGDLSKKELREYWDKADETPGDRTMVEGFGSVTKGELAAAIAEKEADKQCEHGRQRRNFYPSDFSRLMGSQTKEGLRRVRSKM